MAVREPGTRFGESLAADVDEVRWGLPEEYVESVQAALGAEPQPVLVSGAAHGMVGSSEKVFADLARFMARVLGAGLPAEEQEVWRLFDGACNTR